MSLDAIKQVNEAEQDSKRVLAEAAAYAKKVIADAETRGEALLEERKNQAEAQSRQLMTEAQQKAAENSVIILKETENQCAQLRAKAESRMEAASSLFVGRVVNE